MLKSREHQASKGARTLSEGFLPISARPLAHIISTMAEFFAGAKWAGKRIRSGARRGAPFPRLPLSGSSLLCSGKFAGHRVDVRG